MADLFEVADSDASPNDADGGGPSVEAIVAAFRKAAGGRVRRAVPGKRSSARSVLQPPSTPAMSPEEIVEGTIAAFRKAGRRTVERSETSRTEDSGAEETDTDPPETSPGEVSGGPTAGEETREQAEENGTGAPDDLALAFRRALSKRGQASADDPPPGGERREVEGSVETSPEVESRPSTGEGTPLVSTSSFPPRPAPSFLWATDASPGTPEAISVEELSAPRARAAKGFLLEGDGNRPYRLLTRIRGHPKTSIYLKPVFWRRAEGQQSPVADHVDGIWAPGAGEETLDALRERATTINQRVSALSKPEGATAESMAHRMLQFVVTRSAEFAPRRGEEGQIVYSKLTPLLELPSQHEDGGGELADILSTTAQHIREK